MSPVCVWGWLPLGLAHLVALARLWSTEVLCAFGVIVWPTGEAWAVVLLCFQLGCCLVGCAVVYPGVGG